MHRTGIVGASGYTGAELLRLLAAHPELEVAWATGDTQAGARVAALYPSLAAGYPSLTFSRYDATAADGLDLVFCALPHGESQRRMPELEAPDALRHRQRGLHRLRVARPSAHARDRAGEQGDGALHAPPGPHDPRHPGHVLRPSARNIVHGCPARAAARALRHRAV